MILLSIIRPFIVFFLWSDCIISKQQDVLISTEWKCDGERSQLLAGNDLGLCFCGYAECLCVLLQVTPDPASLLFIDGFDGGNERDTLIQGQDYTKHLIVTFMNVSLQQKGNITKNQLQFLFIIIKTFWKLPTKSLTRDILLNLLEPRKELSTHLQYYPSNSQSMHTLI